ncbi:peptidoglycan DD-metalloendopeptidase family protein [Desulfovirgula thermocuniculi]|uniref:peptidoglycan DD-metalloendopeptidase family protein n=1 Tax=Desulfovirgula thermocuniculi TaxID=348842 RepID=UPI00040324D1|nr:M23 family metallopeptidase [Desulfovirgula thermocuniculi]
MVKPVKKLIAALTLALCLLGGPGLLAASPEEAVVAGGPYALLPAEQREAGGSWLEYRVRRGDTLASLAERFGLPPVALQEVNAIEDPDRIVAGQVLKVPVEALTHTVAPGETLSEIGRRYRVAVERLVAANGLDDPDRLVPGQTLAIPGAGSDGQPQPARAAALPVAQLAWPVMGNLSSPFGLREGRPHEGVDIAAGEGEPIRAARAGRVIFAGPRGTYGNTVILYHGGGLTTLYAHARKILVRPGEFVKEGDVIALVGSTGRSTGPHLHFEVRLNGIPYDPLLCLKRLRA